jgi:hypothetical protein
MGGRANRTCHDGQVYNPKIYKEMENQMFETKRIAAIERAINNIAQQKGALMKAEVELTEVLEALIFCKDLIKNTASAGTESGIKETTQVDDTTDDNELPIGKWVMVLRGPYARGVGQVMENDIPGFGVKVWLGGQPHPMWFLKDNLQLISSLEVRMF